MAEENFGEQEIGGVLEVGGMPDTGSMPETGGMTETGGMPETGSMPDTGGMTEMGGMPEDSNPPEVHESENDQKSESAVNDSEKKWPGWPGENVFRLLVPVQKVGSIIGRKGEYIKKTCEETKARIKILDGPPGTPERTVFANLKQTAITKVASH